MLHTSLLTAVIIATKNRCDFLSNRAVPSILAQTQSPDFLIVCDDSSLDIQPSNRELISELSISGCTVIYTTNRRTPGASGCWNSAIDTLFAQVNNPNEVLLLFLDDDDSWEKTYIETCSNNISNNQLDMVASGLCRIESIDDTPLITQAPECLLAEEFLVSNPGIQGSNLCLRLSVFLEAGGFDEDLQSTTDRDLCIRLADLGTVRYKSLPDVLVKHYAEFNRPRLSIPSSLPKLNGLSSFWRKYVGRMSDQQQNAFTQRAMEVFGWEPPVSFSHSKPDRNSKTTLVIGLMPNIDSTFLFHVVSTLVSNYHHGIVGIDVVFLRQTSDIPEHFTELSIKQLRDAGVGCFVYPNDDETPVFDDLISEYSAEYLLLNCCWQVAQKRPGTEVWWMTGRNHVKAIDADDIHQQLKNWGASRIIAAPINDKDPKLPFTQGKQLDRWLHQQRVKTARHRIIQRFSLNELRELGSGSEAVVFTDGQTVFKCIDYWKSRIPDEQLKFLREQGQSWENVPGIYQLKLVERDGPWVLITYQYEVSEPYQGGYESDLIKLLNGCTKANIVCNNIHPKNLVVTSFGVKLIDYGSDIRPWSKLGFEHMAIRAFLACYHSRHPELTLLMRRALTDPNLPELVGFQQFYGNLDKPFYKSNVVAQTIGKAPEHQPFALCVGVISANPDVLLPMLRSLLPLKSNPSIQKLTVLVLNNGCALFDLERAVQQVRIYGLEVLIVSEEQQKADALSGCFGTELRVRAGGQVGISLARTMLQRYLGIQLNCLKHSIGWILDDDMRADYRANDYLPWLPALREHGVDIVIGAYEGASPNPPLNGLRVQLMDLAHNFQWLANLPAESVLPDRSIENKERRYQYPDYYYDLSRKHYGHLESPLWLEPAYPHETVAEAKARLIASAIGIVNGDPITRGIFAQLPENPLEQAVDSVNRGGCTFILNPVAITQTPNHINQVQGREARRSDMIWAIVNRYYRGLSIKACGFPIQHVGRVTEKPGVNIEKVQGEIVGSALYAGLTDFLKHNPHHQLNFSAAEITDICNLSITHMETRLRLLEISFYRIIGLSNTLKNISPKSGFERLTQFLDDEFNLEMFKLIRSGVMSLKSIDIQHFLTSLRPTADAYNAAEFFPLSNDFLKTVAR